LFDPFGKLINILSQYLNKWRWGLLKIATFNVNGVNGRLLVLLRWLVEAKPDVVCLHELKARQEKFPEAGIREAGYGAIWHGQKSWKSLRLAF
jgi:exodeoxyribonuclease III